MKTAHLVYMVCALCIGVAVATLFSVVHTIPALLFVGIGVIVFLIYIFLYIIARRNFLVLILVFFICFGIAITNYAFSKKSTIETHLSAFLYQESTVTGVIVAEPDIRENKQFLVVKTQTINEVDLETKIRVTTYRHSEFEYHDHIVLEGTLKKPDAFETESGRTFHYDNYLLNQGMTATMFQPRIVQHETGKRNIIRGLLRVKSWFLHRIEKVLPFPQSGLLEGLLLGVRAIPDALYDDFRRTGIVHIVVLSGYNVMLVANFIVGLLKRHAKWIQFVGVIGSLLIFMIITGMQTTVIRATIMGGIAAIGRIMGAEYSITKSLAIAAALMILINPFTLIYDISFQLSFLATIGLVYLGPLIEPIFRWLPEQFEIKENMIATWSTSFFVMPLIAYAVGDLSIVSPLTNLVVLPLVAPAMALGFITALASLLGPVAWIPAIPTYLCLWIIIHAAIFLGSFSWASIVLPIIPVWGLVGIYGILFGIIIWQRRKVNAS
ncbi:ComEC/Rec2 family competence protein [Candidatus Nomurabacteria bacterium]|nr:ComEC/Rec2 family competence protein [Candidatus Nomurabacteria bacterium]